MAVPAAKLYLILAVYLAALIRGVESLVSHSEPSLQWDGNTTKDCTVWYDNIDGYTCRQVRDDFLRIPPEDFTRWNPSITLDCDNWKFLSYCIEVASEMTTTTSTPRHTTTSSTSTTSTVRPTPIAWEPLGCYVDGNPHTVRNRSEKASGQDLTIAKCQDDCWASGYRHAGVTGGMECYCGRFVANEHTPDQSDCNIPCAGDDSETCGGSSAMYAYGAKTYELPPWTITIPHPSATPSDDKPTVSSYSGSPETSDTSEASTTSKGEAGEDEESTATSHFGGTRAAALLIMIALL
jgi:hypothetical protein